jgi:hypothetical protein
MLMNVIYCSYLQRTNSFGTCALCLTLDGKVVLGRRASNLAACPNMWHFVPAGTVDRPDALAVIKDEMREELEVKILCFASYHLHSSKF